MCKTCNGPINLSDQEGALLEKFHISQLAYCFHCSWQRKMQWQNEYQVYRRSCSATGKNIISIFSEDTAFPVFERKYWLSDKWEVPKLEYDPKKSFLEQYFELSKLAPRPHNNQVNTVNSEYAHLIFDSKDCYLSFQAFECEKLLYCYRSIKLKESMNCFFCSNSELLYESVNCNKCYNLNFSQDCSGCSDSSFLFDCRNCSHCFLSWNLRSKQYCILNKQFTKDEYEREIRKFDLSNWEYLKEALELFEKNKKNFIKRATYIINSENCTGDFLINCNNCHNSFFTDDSQNSSNIMRGTLMKSVYDSVVGGLIEMGYNLLQPGWLYKAAYTISCNNGNEIYFSEYCDSCTECVGCIGLRGGKFCILNKPYSEKEYFVLKEQILSELMNKKGDDFFDPLKSPFKYEETIADLYFPKERQMNSILPQKFVKLEVQDQNIQLCCSCQKPFNIIDREIKFSHDKKVLLTGECFKCRIRRLARSYSIIQTETTACANCKKDILSSFSKSYEKIYCEECYLQTVY